MGRRREFDTGEVLTAIREQFWKHGYAATSIEDLLRVTSLGKGSFYGAFGDKRTLFVQVLQDYADQHHESQRETFEGKRAIDALRGFLIPACNPRGCLLVNTTFELAPQDDEILDLVRKNSERTETLLADTARRAIAEGDLPASTNVRDLATTLLVFAHGQDTLARSGASKAKLSRIGKKAGIDLLGER